MFAMLSALTDARAVVNYVEALQLLDIPCLLYTSDAADE